MEEKQARKRKEMGLMQANPDRPRSTQNRGRRHDEDALLPSTAASRDKDTAPPPPYGKNNSATLIL